MAASEDAISLPAILVNPVHLQPLFWVALIWRNQVKVFRVCVWTWRMAEWLHVTGQKEIEWFDLITVGFSFVELFQRSHYSGAANGYLADSREVLELNA